MVVWTASTAASYGEVDRLRHRVTPGATGIDEVRVARNVKGYL